MRILVKFMSEFKYVDDFLAGKLYMNTLGYFRNNGFKEQKDYFEGTVYSLSPQQSFPESFAKSSACDIRITANGYEFCNVCCFYQFDCSVLKKKKGFIKYLLSDTDKMNAFGDYVVLIKDEKKFIKQVLKAASEQDFLCVCGPVQYHALEKEGVMTPAGRHCYVKRDEDIDLFNDININAMTKQYDCFDKNIQYASQKEWRIALYRGIRSTDAYTLEVGDLHDIVSVVHFEGLDKELEKALSKKRIKFNGSNQFVGNIERSQLRDLFYALGDNKGTEIITLGNSDNI